MKFYKLIGDQKRYKSFFNYYACDGCYEIYSGKLYNTRFINKLVDHLAYDHDFGGMYSLCELCHNFSFFDKFGVKDYTINIEIKGSIGTR